MPCKSFNPSDTCILMDLCPFQILICRFPPTRQRGGTLVVTRELGDYTLLRYLHRSDQNRICVDDYASLQDGAAGHGPATCKHNTASNLAVLGDPRFFCDSDAKTIMEKFYSPMNFGFRRNYGAKHQADYPISKFGERLEPVPLQARGR